MHKVVSGSHMLQVKLVKSLDLTQLPNKSMLRYMYQIVLLLLVLLYVVLKFIAQWTLCILPVIPEVPKKKT